MKRNHTSQTLVWRWFWAVTAWPKTIIVLGLVMVIGFPVYVPDLVKDTRSDAFLPDDEPALLYRDKVTYPRDPWLSQVLR